MSGASDDEEWVIDAQPVPAHHSPRCQQPAVVTEPTYLAVWTGATKVGLAWLDVESEMIFFAEVDSREELSRLKHTLCPKVILTHSKANAWLSENGVHLPNVNRRSCRRS